MIDINTPLEQQGPFDLVLHKLTSEIIDSKFKSRLDSIEVWLFHITISLIVF